mmetsp:Transcript_20986/g.60644  ORF Transcript_20986/g.60644 Transcript_20986/m.60644 type:complete len:300 (-) Transcript_20986:452-1351(-)
MVDVEKVNVIIELFVRMVRKHSRIVDDLFNAHCRQRFLAPRHLISQVRVTEHRKLRLQNQVYDQPEFGVAWGQLRHIKGVQVHSARAIQGGTSWLGKKMPHAANLFYDSDNLFEIETSIRIATCKEGMQHLRRDAGDRPVQSEEVAHASTLLALQILLDVCGWRQSCFAEVARLRLGARRLPEGHQVVALVRHDGLQVVHHDTWRGCGATSTNTCLPQATAKLALRRLLRVLRHLRGCPHSMGRPSLAVLPRRGACHLLHRGSSGGAVLGQRRAWRSKRLHVGCSGAAVSGPQALPVRS